MSHWIGAAQISMQQCTDHSLDSDGLNQFVFVRGKINNFAQVPDENNDSDVVVVRSPGLGEMVFERTED